MFHQTCLKPDRPVGEKRLQQVSLEDGGSQPLCHPSVHGLSAELWLSQGVGGNAAGLLSTSLHLAVPLRFIVVASPSPGTLGVDRGGFKILLWREEHINITPIVLD